MLTTLIEKEVVTDILSVILILPVFAMCSNPPANLNSSLNHSPDLLDVRESNDSIAKKPLWKTNKLYLAWFALWKVKPNNKY